MLVDPLSFLTSYFQDRLNDFVAIEESRANLIRTEAERQHDYNDCIKEEVDIEMFVSSNRTGYSRPGPLLYENYYTGLQKDAVFGMPLDKHLESTDSLVPNVVKQCAAIVEARVRDRVLRASSMSRD